MLGDKNAHSPKFTVLTMLVKGEKCQVIDPQKFLETVSIRISYWPKPAMAMVIISILAIRLLQLEASQGIITLQKQKHEAAM